MEKNQHLRSSPPAFSPGQEARTLSLAHKCLLIFILALGIRLFYLFASLPTGNAIKNTEPGAIALSLSSNKKFADAYGTNTGYTAHMAPIQPLYLSLIYSVFGTDHLGDRAKQVNNGILCSLKYALLPVVADCLGLPVAAGSLAGIIGAVWDEPTMRLELSTPFEQPLASLELVLLFISSLRFGWKPGTSIRMSMLQGAWWGFALLTAPSLLLILLVFIGTDVLLFFKAQPVWLLRRVGATTITLLLVLTPWMIRNYLRLGYPIWSRSNFGLELYISNNDFAHPTEQDTWRSENIHLLRHPSANDEERARLREVGEVAYNRVKLQTALNWIRTHPQQFMTLSLQRIRYFWFPDKLSRRYNYSDWLIVVSAWMGLIIIWRANPVNATLIASVLISYPIVYYFVEASFRYRYPIHWILLICSSYVFYSVIKYLLRHRTGAASPRQR